MLAIFNDLLWLRFPTEAYSKRTRRRSTGRSPDHAWDLVLISAAVPFTQSQVARRAEWRHSAVQRGRHQTVAGGPRSPSLASKNHPRARRRLRCPFRDRVCCPRRRIGRRGTHDTLAGDVVLLGSHEVILGSQITFRHAERPHWHVFVSRSRQCSGRRAAQVVGIFEAAIAHLAPQPLGKVRSVLPGGVRLPAHA